MAPTRSSTRDLDHEPVRPMTRGMIKRLELYFGVCEVVQSLSQKPVLDRRGYRGGLPGILKQAARELRQLQAENQALRRKQKVRRMTEEGMPSVPVQTTSGIRSAYPSSRQSSRFGERVVLKRGTEGNAQHTGYSEPLPHARISDFNHVPASMKPVYPLPRLEDESLYYGLMASDADAFETTDTNGSQTSFQWESTSSDTTSSYDTDILSRAAVDFATPCASDNQSALMYSYNPGPTNYQPQFVAHPYQDHAQQAPSIDNFGYVGKPTLNMPFVTPSTNDDGWYGERTQYTRSPSYYSATDDFGLGAIYPTPTKHRHEFHHAQPTHNTWLNPPEVQPQTTHWAMPRNFSH